MVIHEENEAPVEVAIIKKPAVLETKKYVIVKNHVRELNISEQKEDSEPLTEENAASTSENEVKKKRKPRTKSKKCKSSGSNTESDDASNKVTEISKDDLEELRTVYKKCKAVIQRIETKYGHLLQLDNETERTTQLQRKRKIEEEDYEECKCTANKKIIFNDDGEQLVSETSLEKHVCLKKLAHNKKECKSHDNLQIGYDNVQIEYDKEETSLPDDLNELASILKDGTIDKVYRNKVIAKIKNIKRDNLEEIKFYKPSLIENLKSNPEEVLDFHGTNLSELPGYGIQS